MDPCLNYSVIIDAIIASIVQADKRDIGGVFKGFNNVSVHKLDTHINADNINSVDATSWILPDIANFMNHNMNDMHPFLDDYYLYNLVCKSLP